MKKLLLSLAGGVLLFAVAVNAYLNLMPTPPATLPAPLTEVFPQNLPGWQIKDMDMAESPESSARISDFLNFDDALFRVFQKGDTFVGLYVAYWTPGKVSYRWAGAHTPDTCWIVNGWSCTERANEVPFGYGAYQFEPAEFGIYEKDGNAQKVYFWHLIGGEAFRYKQEGVPNILGALLDVKEYGLDLRQEQYFIRLSSNKSLEELKQMPGFQSILDGLAELAKAAASSGMQPE